MPPDRRKPQHLVQELIQLRAPTDYMTESSYTQNPNRHHRTTPTFSFSAPATPPSRDPISAVETQLTKRSMNGVKIGAFSLGLNLRNQEQQNQEDPEEDLAGRRITLFM